MVVVVDLNDCIWDVCLISLSRFDIRGQREI